MVADLVCHPSTPVALPRGMRVRVWRRDGVLALAFHVEGEPAGLRLPASGPLRRGDRLWEHTCCEVFIAGPDGGAYHEVNLAPSGAWAAYRFLGYRERAGEVDADVVRQLAVRRAAGHLVLEATVSLDDLLGAEAPAVLQLGLAAVIEAADGTLSYWALRHPPGPPDFHHRDAFALRLASPGAACEGRGP
jgi:hypothetical protein